MIKSPEERTKIRTLEQERAKYAWEQVKRVKGDSKIEARYSSYVKKMPALILTNGLGNALAFTRSKFGPESEEKLRVDAKAYKLLYQHLNGWFSKQAQVNKDILDWIVNDASSLEVLRITEETIALLNWMKRFADAELKGEESE